MNIALFCWVGQGALADDLIAHVTKGELARFGHCVSLGPWPSFNSLVDCLAGFDHLIFGGGSLLGPTNMYPLNCVPDWYSRVGRPLHLLGTGFRKESQTLNEHQRRLNAFLFKVLTTSWPRGHVSDEELKGNGIFRVHNGFGDPGVLFRPSHFYEFESSGPHLGLVVRNIPKEEVRYVENETVHRFFVDFVRQWGKVRNGTVHFICFRHNNPLYDNDAEAAKRVAADSGVKGFRLHTPGNWLEAGNLVCSMDYLLSQRLHPTVIGLANGVRAVGMDYQFRKMEDFASTVGFSHWMSTYELDCQRAMEWLLCGDFKPVFDAASIVARSLRSHIQNTFLEVPC